MIAVLIAALTHDVAEQHASLGRIDHVFDRGREGTKCRRSVAGGMLISLGSHALTLRLLSLTGMGHGAVGQLVAPRRGRATPPEPGQCEIPISAIIVGLL
jgi:hypothetical protein